MHLVLITPAVLLMMMSMGLGIIDPTIQTFEFVTPGSCYSNSTMEEQFLISTSHVKTRAHCAKECAYNQKCR